MAPKKEEHFHLELYHWEIYEIKPGIVMPQLQSPQEVAVDRVVKPLSEVEVEVPADMIRMTIF
jgi:hypothetical protein